MVYNLLQIFVFSCVLLAVSQTAAYRRRRDGKALTTFDVFSNHTPVICQQGLVMGSGNESLKRYYFVSKSNECRSFTFRGSESSGNHFFSRAQCENVCMSKKYVHITIREFPKVCDPPVLLSNDTNSNWPERLYYFYYDHKTKFKECKDLNNVKTRAYKNTFAAKKDCQAICNQSPHMQQEILDPVPKEACLLPKVSGMCRHAQSRWYFDQTTNTCEPFLYQGCYGNWNNFVSYKDCRNTCKQYLNVNDDKKKQTHCGLPKDPGNCWERRVRYYYDPDLKKCLAFEYSGGGGNANNFLNPERCMSVCSNYTQQGPSSTSTYEISASTLNNTLSLNPSTKSTLSKNATVFPSYTKPTSTNVSPDNTTRPSLTRVTTGVAILNITRNQTLSTGISKNTKHDISSTMAPKTTTDNCTGTKEIDKITLPFLPATRPPSSITSINVTEKKATTRSTAVVINATHINPFTTPAIETSKETVSKNSSPLPVTQTSSAISKVTDTENGTITTTPQKLPSRTAVGSKIPLIQHTTTEKGWHSTGEETPTGSETTRESSTVNNKSGKLEAQTTTPTSQPEATVTNSKIIIQTKSSITSASRVTGEITETKQTASRTKFPGTTDNATSEETVTTPTRPKVTTAQLTDETQSMATVSGMSAKTQQTVTETGSPEAVSLTGTKTVSMKTITTNSAEKPPENTTSEQAIETKHAQRKTEFTGSTANGTAIELVTRSTQPKVITLIAKEETSLGALPGGAEQLHQITTSTGATERTRSTTISENLSTNMGRETDVASETLSSETRKKLTSTMSPLATTKLTQSTSTTASHASAETVTGSPEVSFPSKVKPSHVKTTTSIGVKKGSKISFSEPTNETKFTQKTPTFSEITIKENTREAIIRPTRPIVTTTNVTGGITSLGPVTGMSDKTSHLFTETGETEKIMSSTSSETLSSITETEGNITSESTSSATRKELTSTNGTTTKTFTTVEHSPETNLQQSTSELKTGTYELLTQSTSAASSHTAAEAVTVSTSAAVSHTSAEAVTGSKSATASHTSAEAITGSTSATASHTSAEAITGSTSETASHTSAEAVTGTTRATTSRTSAKAIRGSTSVIASHTPAEAVTGSTSETASHTSAEAVTGLTSATASHTSAEAVTGSTSATTSHTSAEAVTGSTSATAIHTSAEAVTGSTSATTNHTSTVAVRGSTSVTASHTPAEAVTGSTSETASHTSAEAITGSVSATAGHTPAEAVTGSTSVTASHTSAEAVTGSTSVTVSHTSPEAVTGSTSETASHTSAEAVTGSTSATARHTSAEAVTGSTSATVSHTSPEAVTGSTSETASHTSAEAVTGSTSETASHTSAEAVRGSTNATARHTSAETVTGSTSATVSHTSAEAMTGSTSATVSHTSAEAVTGSTSETSSHTSAEAVTVSTSAAVTHTSTEAVTESTRATTSRTSAEAVTGSTSETTSHFSAEAVRGSTSVTASHTPAEAVTGSTSSTVSHTSAEAVTGSASETASHTSAEAITGSPEVSFVETVPSRVTQETTARNTEKSTKTVSRENTETKLTEGISELTKIAQTESSNTGLTTTLNHSTFETEGNRKQSKSTAAETPEATTETGVSRKVTAKNASITSNETFTVSSTIKGPIASLSGRTKSSTTSEGMASNKRPVTTENAAIVSNSPETTQEKGTSRMRSEAAISSTAGVDTQTSVSSATETYVATSPGRSTPFAEKTPGGSFASQTTHLHSPVTHEFTGNSTEYGHSGSTKNKLTSTTKSLSFCSEPIDRGHHCTDYRIRYGYVAEKNKCVPFVYHGCDGNANNFATISTCYGHCCRGNSAEKRSVRPHPRLICMMPYLKPSCTPSSPVITSVSRWWFNFRTGKCIQVQVNDCASENVYVSRLECEQFCEETGTICINVGVELKCEAGVPAIDTKFNSLAPVSSTPMQPVSAVTGLVSSKTTRSSVDCRQAGDGKVNYRSECNEFATTRYYYKPNQNRCIPYLFCPGKAGRTFNSFITRKECRTKCVLRGH